VLDPQGQGERGPAGVYQGVKIVEEQLSMVKDAAQIRGIPH
jgi:hypothetical protein